MAQDTPVMPLRTVEAATLLRTLATWRGEPQDVAIVERLLQEAELAQDAYAPNTLRARLSDLKVWSSWCRSRLVTPLPARPDVVTEFIRDMRAAPRSLATIRRYVDTIGYLHKVTELPNPAHARGVILTMKGLRRQTGIEARIADAGAEAKRRIRGKQAVAVTEEMVEAILPTIPDTPRGRRDRALLLVARDLLTRVSELIALQVADVAPGLDHVGLVMLTRQKTDAEPKMKSIRPHTFLALRAYVTQAALVEGPLFRGVKRNGHVRAHALNVGEVGKIFRRLVSDAGLSANGISGHSCRVGMAQDLAAAGATLPQLMDAGDWRSPAMPARYTEHLFALRGAVVTLLKK